MKKITLAFGLIFLITQAWAQNTASFDGISLKPSSKNGSTFYYGEPFRLYFEITNEENAIKQYYKPMSESNFTMTLKNLITGQLDSPVIRLVVSHRNIEDTREDMRLSPPPSKSRSYKPNETIYRAPHMFDAFGEEYSGKEAGEFSSNLLPKNLYSIPPGSYELIIEYYLFPGNEKLTVRHQFQIVKLPASEKFPYEKYIDATLYACKNQFKGPRTYTETNYKESNDKSYENFIKRYPNSIFAQYAMMDMVTKLYHYPIVNDKIRKEKIVRFTNYYPHIQRPALQLEYVQELPKTLMIKNNKNAEQTKTELDQFLKQIKNDPVSSKFLIQNAEQNGIKGLKDYSQGRGEKD